MMNELLRSIGLNQKETLVYLALLELGMQSGSNVSKKVGLPKSTVLFILDRLVKLGYVQKTQRGNTHYFFTDPKLLLQAKQKALEEEEKALKKVIPLLSEIKNPYSSFPKVTFFEGSVGCKKGYGMILESETEVLEFGIHKDLEERLGKDFIEDFIDQRIKKGLHLRAISTPNPTDLALSKLDKVQLRDQKFLSPDAETYSSIAVFDEKVFLMNLRNDPFGILIESSEISQTLRTIFESLWAKI